MPNQKNELYEILRLSTAHSVELKKQLAEMIENVGDNHELRDLHSTLFLREITFIDRIRKAWITQPSMPIAKDCMGAARIGKKIYTVGGRTEFGADSMLQHEASLVQVFDIDSKQWATKKGMLFPHTGNSIVASNSGKIYSFGGYLKYPDTISSDHSVYIDIFSKDAISYLVQLYDPTTDTWVRKNDMPISRVFHSAVANDDGAVFIFGGYEHLNVWPDPGNPQPSINKASETLRYSIAADQWTKVSSMPTARTGLTAVKGHDGLIYAMGGLGDSCEYLATVEVYDPKNDIWLKGVDMLTPRSSFSAVVDSSGKIYVIGGVAESGSINSVEVFDPVAGSWAKGHPIYPDRLSHGAVISDDNRIFVIGGSQHSTEASPHMLASCISQPV